MQDGRQISRSDFLDGMKAREHDMMAPSRCLDGGSSGSGRWRSSVVACGS